MEKKSKKNNQQTEKMSNEEKLNVENEELDVDEESAAALPPFIGIIH